MLFGHIRTLGAVHLENNAPEGQSAEQSFDVAFATAH